ncbi:MAG TPA: polysaccharide biosynthesis/export family protein [Candidatus Acidoferrum sp.]|nr:polysaccharide biosynthesis/export family protein [Candidatus Acidoferrum sp.]
MIGMKALGIGLVLLFLGVSVRGQSPSGAEANPSNPRCIDQTRSTYLLGPDDQLEISGPELTDSAGDKRARIDSDGDMQAPLVGRIHVAGLTVQQAEEALDKALSTYIREPQVVLNVVEVRSQPVSILGAVNTPGVHQVQGHKTLMEMLASAGGIRPDAGYSVHITRELEWGCIPLPGAKLDPSGQFSVAEVNLKEIMEAKDPAENIQIFPHDVISVPKAEMVYVVGDVKRSGGFVLGERQSISVLQALSLAEGLNGTADAKHAKILRLNRDKDQREELPVDVKALLKGKKQDVSLQGDDILFIPASTGKKAALRAVEAAVQTGTGLAIWRMP